MPSNEFALRRVSLVRLPELRHWLASAVLATTAGLYVLAGLSLAWFEPARATPHARLAGPGAVEIPGLGIPPEPEPLQFREIAPQDAVAINAAVPVSTLPNPAARPFAVAFATPADRLRALECLTAAVYYEAAVETTDGQRAVAQVVLNRVRHPAYPRTVCGVVFQGSERATGCQFTFTCDGALRRTPSAAGWARARKVAEEALAGHVHKPVGWATHYHTNWVVPYWSSSLVKVANVGTHIFYRWEGGWGRPPAFRDGHAGTEPVLPKMGYLGFGAVPEETDELTPEERAALLAAELPEAQLAEGAPMPAAVAASSYDPGALNRAIIRRFEPVKRDGVAATLAKQTAAGAKVDESHRWALTGEGAGAGEALGKKAPAPAPEPKTVS